MMRSIRNLLGNADGAVAPIVALSLVGLVAAGGIAFDYARLASMDTELQTAADQAALAAAAQLDGQDGACERAVAAARGMVAHQTLMANDGGGLAVTIPDPGVCNADTSITFDADASVRFYQDADKTDPSDDDSNAKFVEVQVDSREARFALTPIVAAFSSGQINAKAFAGLGEAICNSPPVMICNPSEPTTNLNKNYPFDVSALVGKGLLLTSVGNGGGTWAPGNFGYLQNGSPVNNPVLQLKQALGWTAIPGNCLPTSGVDTRTGANTPVTDAVNTRFDIYTNGGPGGNGCPGGGACPASIDSVKDLIRKQSSNNCGIGPQGWQEGQTPYMPTSATADMSSNFPTAMGHPRDKCHAVATSVTGACTGPIGDGDWDRNTYFRTNYGCLTSSAWQSGTGLGASPTRYAVYEWEIAHRGTVLCSRSVLSTTGRASFGTGGNTELAYDAPVCSGTQGYGTGTIPDESTPDRRRITSAVVNCHANSVNGNSTNVPVLQWIDLFLVEPSTTRNRTAPQRATGQQDVYAEVIGGSTVSTNGAFQTVKKAVPYLIQ